MLIRAARFAALTQKSHAFYLVDDFLAALEISGAPASALVQAETDAAQALRGARHIFTITSGLGESVRARYGVSATTLPLAFEPAPRPVGPVQRQIIYVGSINFLYAEGMRHLIRLMDKLRQNDAADLKLRLTVSPEVAAKAFGALPPFVLSSPVATSDGLAQEIASSLFAFLPYSFSSREKNMVTTSFPSKSMEYLAYARSIVVYGPDYGVATRLFRDMQLPTVASSLEELEDTLRLHLSSPPDHSFAYRRYLTEFHSLSAIRKTICTALGLDPGGQRP
ncbi:hypothetical protein DYQ86_20970 [Acidobacteria bacterium AB60]|nr:hypothetical protein DYQ86_20970 [Acidobacteria bacterium AB60]